MKPIRLVFTSCAVLLTAIPIAGAQQSPENAQPPHKMMMGGGEMPMTGTMHHGGMMMPLIGMGDHIEGRLAYLKTELKITDAQLPQWNAFAAAARASATQMNDMMKQGSAMMMPGGSEPTLPQRFELAEKHMSAHLEMLRKLKSALLPLYTALSDEQKRAADALFQGPMGM
jgi:hypothetical protein